MTAVDIIGLPKADVLAALYNAAEAPRYMGALQFPHGPFVMDRPYAQHLIEHGNTATPDYGGVNLTGRDLYFDHLHGRCLKVDLTDNDSFDAWGFDRDNGGEGAAQRVIDTLRQTGEIAPKPTMDAKSWLRQVTNKALQRYDEGDIGGALAQFMIGTARHSGTQHIPKNDFGWTIVAMGLQGDRSEAEKAMIGFTV